MRSTPPPSPKFSDLRARDRRSGSGTPPPPLRRITPPPPTTPQTPSLSSFRSPPSKTFASVHSPPPPSPRSPLRPQHYTPRRDMEPTRPGAIHSVRVGTWSRPPPPPQPPSGSRAVSSPHYRHPPHPVGSSFRGITPESSNGPFGAQSVPHATTYSVANGSAGHRELPSPPNMPPPPPPPQRLRVTGDAPHRLEKMVEECDSIPYADEEGSRDAIMCCREICTSSHY